MFGHIDKLAHSHRHSSICHRLLAALAIGKRREKRMWLEILKMVGIFIIWWVVYFLFTLFFCLLMPVGIPTWTAAIVLIGIPILVGVTGLVRYNLTYGLIGFSALAIPVGLGIVGTLAELQARAHYNYYH